MNLNPNIVFFGSPAFSAKIMDSLDNVVAAVTSPDAPIGRKAVLTPSAVAQLAQEKHLPVFKPPKLDDNNLTHIKLLNPYLFIVASYGQIIPPSWLQTPPLGVLNIHFSLLPKYRGALCISEAIKNQDQFTGVTLMQMDAELDHGPILAQQQVKIEIDDDVTTLTDKLTIAAIELLNDSLPKFLQNSLPSTPQDHSLATFTPTTKTRTRQEAFVPWDSVINGDPAATHALIRSLNPDPGAWTTIPTDRGPIEAKLIKTSLSDKLTLETIQLPSRSPMPFKQFLVGYKLS